MRPVPNRVFTCRLMIRMAQYLATEIFKKKRYYYSACLIRPYGPLLLKKKLRSIVRIRSNFEHLKVQVKSTPVRTFFEQYLTVDTIGIYCYPNYKSHVRIYEKAFYRRSVLNLKLKFYNFSKSI